MRLFDTVLFDMDGTLLDTLDDLWDSLNHILTENGYPPRSREEIRSFLGNGSRALLAKALPLGEADPRFEVLLEAYKAWYNDRCQCKTRPYPGTADLLAALSAAGCATAIVSNKHTAAVEELDRHFFHTGVVVGQTEGVGEKPAPDMVLLALERLGRDRTGAVYVGDSEVDFQTAQNAGLPCVLVSWGFRDRAALERLHPLRLVDSREELRKFLLGE